MTLDQLKVLHTILEKGSFRAAAETLHRAQSAVSYAIKNLEEEFQIALFTREGYRPQLTPEGEAIYRKAKILLDHAEDLTCLGQQLAMGQEPELRLAVNAVCPLPPLMRVLKEFFVKNRHTQLKLWVENLGGSIERLSEGSADLALTEVFDPESDLERLPWAKIQFIPVAAPDHPLAQSVEMLRQNEFRGHVQIAVRDTSLNAAPKTIGILDGSVIWTVSDFATKRELMLAGLGWGFMPAHLVQEELKEGRLKLLNMEGHPLGQVEIFLVRHRHRPVGPVATHLWQVLQECQHG